LLRRWKIRLISTLVLVAIVLIAVLLLYLFADGIQYFLANNEERGPGLPGFIGWVVANIIRFIANFWPWIILAIVLAFPIRLFFANHAYYKAQREYFLAVERQNWQIQNLTEKAIYCGREASRLEQLLTPLEDWVAICGWVLHHPYDEVLDKAGTVDDEVIASFPASFGIAKALLNEKAPRRLISQSVGLIYPQGWAKRAFDHAYGEYSKESADEDQGGFLGPEMDVSSSPVGPRRELLDYWSGGTASKTLTNGAVHTLKNAVAEGNLELQKRHVVRQGHFGHGDAEAEPDFFRAAGAPSTSFATEMFADDGVHGKQNVEYSQVWLPKGVGAESDSVSTSYRVGGDSLSLRVDTSGTLNSSEVAMFETVTSSPTPAPSPPMQSVISSGPYVTGESWS
jgi:hypothetical protein